MAEKNCPVCKIDWNEEERSVEVGDGDKEIVEEELGHGRSRGEKFFSLLRSTTRLSRELDDGEEVVVMDSVDKLEKLSGVKVKQHIFFKDINWGTLAKQKAAFVPASESAIDTSYFRSRYSWNTSDEQFFPSGEVQDYSDDDSLSGYLIMWLF
ncbi:hypothetical protein Rs2_47577 [Raphanus sativus]|nr:hypothetical protein Rs2_47577 [Raphanus sativus]